jgi:hypothetical protein
MKRFLYVLLLAVTFISGTANAASKCDQNKNEIGTKIQVNLALNNGKSESRVFEVTSCKNGTFTAYDKSQNPTILQYIAGQGDSRQIRFVGVTQGPANFQPVITGQWNIRTQQVTFATPRSGQCPTNEHWDNKMKMCMPDINTKCPVGYHWDSSVEQCMPNQAHQCPVGQHWDPNMGSGMCMPNAPAPQNPQHKCPPGQHWDPNMGTGMCMPDQPTPPNPHGCPPGQHWDPNMGNGMCMPDQPGNCPPGQHWDPVMKMCMAGGNSNGVMTMFEGNQYLMQTTGTGPRGKSGFSAPNMMMVMVDKSTSDLNTLEIMGMLTTDLWTVPRNGTPELFQTGEANAAGKPYLDAQHPHSSPIMGLTFADILRFGSNGQNKITFIFAPRGEATAGPESFMHRPSSEGNPDAPLGHHLQDVFHIESNVKAVKIDYGKWTVEGSTFSGRESSPAQVNLPLPPADSYGFRANYRVNDNVTVGGSYARVHAVDLANNPLRLADDERAYAAWIQTTNIIRNGTLHTATIWGQNDNRTSGDRLNSFLEEFMYELGKNNFYGRLELVQRTPEQLEIQVTDGRSGAKWVKAFTLGAEREVFATPNTKSYAGFAFTKYVVDRQFQPAYGKDPFTIKAIWRIKFNSGMPMGH